MNGKELDYFGVKTYRVGLERYFCINLKLVP
jgi:hypothetical protein